MHLRKISTTAVALGAALVLAACGGDSPSGDSEGDGAAAEVQGVRVTKLGSRTEGMLPFVAYPAFRCRIAGDRFEKLTGSQRPIGRLYAGDERHAVFLGTLLLGDEARPMGYNRDNTRDLAARVERVGDRRWRMIFPYPRFESLVDVIELVPA